MPAFDNYEYRHVYHEILLPGETTQQQGLIVDALRAQANSSIG